MKRRFVAQPSPALEELLRADGEFEDRPFGGWAGELATPSAEPAPPPPEPFRPDPPWWALRGAHPDDPDRADPPEEETP